MKVSAVIPLYNAEKYIALTLDSLLEQTYPIDEIIVVDDCGKDNSVSIVEKYCESYSQIRLIRQEENKGGSAARNRGIFESKSEWVLLMDADDLAHPTLLEKEVKMIQQYMNEYSPILVHPAYQQIDKDGKVYDNSVFRGKQLKFEEQFGALLVRNHIITPSGLLVKKSTVLDIGGFGSFRIIEDYDFVLRMSQTGQFLYVDEPLIDFRRHDTNLTKDINKAKEAERAVVEQYGLSRIREAVFKRHLPNEQNQLDYIGMLYRFDLWEEGYRELSSMGHLENQVSFLFLKAIYFVKNNILKEAQVCFERILTLNDKHGAALNNLGVIFALHGQQDQARNLFKKAISHYPGYMDAEHNINGLLENKEDFKWTWRELRSNLLRYSQ